MKKNTVITLQKMLCILSGYNHTFFQLSSKAFSLQFEFYLLIIRMIYPDTNSLFFICMLFFIPVILIGYTVKINASHSISIITAICIRNQKLTQGRQQIETIRERNQIFYFSARNRQYFFIAAHFIIPPFSFHYKIQGRFSISVPFFIINLFFYFFHHILFPERKKEAVLCRIPLLI